MDIRISGHQVDTGAALQEHAAERLGGVVDKYFDKALSSHVTFGKAPAGAFTCDIVTHVMQGLILKAQGSAHDAHVALDDAAAKIDKQLRRYKRRLTDRHEQADHARDEEEAAYTIFAIDQDEEEEVAADAPLVIAETRVDIPTASVADAVMLMDLRNTPALFFKNAGTGRHNMVYRRADGSIGWVEPR
ncbi:ribosome hibernation-promoting factor, HPF/YfiA family [Erythrobacter dokdonensis]|jgi:ribosomal subunit interface protein|uniref:Ribosome hibernation promoting factor n=1 Tax=Erythrobacter dokdonensis DSW-74 TaxID=1300349 RepID=A0A1A7BH67_9SPHN|nr:ribosome-associated translation inhibitor RaiA [Erythrobacter dokdonensis]MEE4317269.1 ribosome-associated translation inhibitor RaiA [Erythrobacter sp.]OBV10772.1 Ribosome-associated protein Y [Erythrobacter dokdonensis DSW-74]